MVTWSELTRFEDPCLATAVATSIASMEFEVRLTDRLVVEVRGEHLVELFDVLEEIIDEQVDFDRRLEQSKGRDRALSRILLVTGAVDFLVLLRILETS